mmetsp:Transcript_561/g.1068  ORF Transcript_561/g.1068 Transcript_561/m.1068 type:complete len:82 (-) Transcript_561:952-1197(-)
MTTLPALEGSFNQPHFPHDDEGAESATANNARVDLSRYSATFDNALVGRFSMVDWVGLLTLWLYFHFHLMKIAVVLVDLLA